MGNLRDIAEHAWNGALKVEGLGPMATEGIEELAPRSAFILSFANVSAFLTDEGLVLVDTGSFMLASDIHKAIRSWTDAPVHTAIYTHGHVDHVFGIRNFDREAAQGTVPARPHVVAHEALPHRFDRYRRTLGYNGHINARQFSLPVPLFPDRYRYPDRVYRDTLDLEIGGEHFLLHHARGETDDATWVYIPSRKILCTGDLFVWVSPNCGNPQKVQRYPEDWARALRTMATLDVDLLLPGHGPPIFGADRVQRALTETATYLESICEQTLSLMNQGLPLADIVEAVEPPDDLLDRPYLQPIYDEPGFIVRNLWRLYGGWYDGNPAHLKPAPPSLLARELTQLAGGPERLAERALELARSGRLDVACHLVEHAGLAAPDNRAVLKARKAVYQQRADEERSLMATGIYTWAAKRK